MKLINFKCPSCKKTIDTATEIDHSQETTTEKTTECFFSQEAHIHCPHCKKILSLIIEKQKLKIKEKMPEAVKRF